MPSYNFSSYRSNPSISGNWNTGGSVVGRGSHAGGITPVGVERNRLGGVTAPRAAPIQPSVIPAVAPPTLQAPISPYQPPGIGQIIETFGPRPPAPFPTPERNVPTQYSNNPVYNNSAPVMPFPAHPAQPTYSPNSPAGMFQGALGASQRLGGQGGGQRTGGGFTR